MSLESNSEINLIYPEDTSIKTELKNEFFVKEDKLLSVVKLFVCKLCKKKFKTKNDLKLHTTEKHNEVPHKYKKKHLQCEYCNHSFNCTTLAISHKLLSHPDKKNYSCPDCDKIFAIKEALDIHLRVHNSNLKETDVFYNSISIKPSEVIQVYACTFCVKTFTGAMEYKKHLKAHSKPPKIIRVSKLYVCEVCHRKFKKNNEYEVHLKEHENIWIPSKKTEQRIRNQGTEKKELLKNQVVEKIPCEYCIAVFTCMSKAIHHKHRFHSQYPNYYCRVCGKLFPLKNAFDNHMNSVHNYDKSPKISIDLCGEYKCIVCQVAFLTESALENHVKTAHVAMQCWSTTGFIPSPSTKIVQGNTSELFSIYYCHLCGSEYALKHNLKQHLIRDHTETERNTKPPEQIIRCVVCTARFFSMKAFETHQLNHSDTDLYVANEEDRRKIVNRIDQDFDISRVPGLL